MDCTAALKIAQSESHSAMSVGSSISIRSFIKKKGEHPLKVTHDECDWSLPFADYAPINQMLFFHSGSERQQDFGRQAFRRKFEGWFQIMIDWKHYQSKAIPLTFFLKLQGLVFVFKKWKSLVFGKCGEMPNLKWRTRRDSNSWPPDS